MKEFKVKFVNLIKRSLFIGAVLFIVLGGLYFLVAEAGYTFDFTTVLKHIPDFNRALVKTLIAALSGLGASFVLGTLVGLGRLSSITLISDVSTTYVQFLRNIPLMIIILGLYFGLGTVFANVSSIMWGILGLSLYEASYIAEIVRGGIGSIPVEQRESADALAMNYYQKMRYVILPQAFRNIIPALTGQFVMLIKHSSLLMVVGVMELTLRSRYLLSVTFQALEVYIFTTLYYFAICFPLAMVSRYLEKKLAIEEVS